MSGSVAKPLFKRRWLKYLTAFFVTVLLPNWLAQYTKSPLTTVHAVGSLVRWLLNFFYGWTERWSYVLATTGPFDFVDEWLPSLIIGWLTFQLLNHRQNFARYTDRASLEASSRTVLQEGLDHEALVAIHRKIKNRLDRTVTVIVCVLITVLNIGSTVVNYAVTTRRLWDHRMIMLKPFVTAQQYDTLNAAFAGVRSKQDARQVYVSFNAIVERERKRSAALTKSGQESKSDLIPSALTLPPEY